MRRIFNHPFPMKNGSLIAYFRKHNIEFEKKVSMDRARITLDRYKIVCDHLEKFVKSEYGKSDLPFSRISLKTVNDFDVYLRCRMNLKPNTVWGYMTVFKHIILLARNDGLLEANPFCGYYNNTKQVDREYLLEDELLRVYHSKMPTASTALVRDLFVFSGYTGISYSDLKQLKYENVKKLFDGNLWLVYRRKKTNAESTVRLFEIPLEIIDKYNGISDEYLFLVPSNGYCNTLLTTIMNVAGITRKITFHAARHTFATLLLSKGIQIETVSRVLGHSSIKTTQIYAKITNEKLSADMDKFEQLLKSGKNKGKKPIKAQALFAASSASSFV